ncbi:MAG: hypothetical protein HYY04_10220 [Chloroflexi bacterium]|nr:hypothetical protein [Chloroflexota bacterium]
MTAIDTTDSLCAVLPAGRPTRFPTSFGNLGAADVTFKGGLSAPVHAWFRLTYSFSPQLVRALLTRLDTAPHHHILDPFAGAGTTVIECLWQGHRALGIDINPFFVKLGRVSTRWSADTRALGAAIDELLARVRQHRSRLQGKTLDAVLVETGLALPRLHNPLRWWRGDVLADLLLLKQAISTACLSVDQCELLEVALAGILLGVANIHRNHPTLTFCDRNGERIDAVERFTAHAQRMIADLAACRERRDHGAGTVIEGDSTDLASVPGLATAHFDRVVTSPPYPNRISYVWETRPHLYFLDLLTSARDAGDLDQRTIGGTWGTATSSLVGRTIPPSDEAVAEAIGKTVGAIRERDPLMANYVSRYFNMMAAHLASLPTLLRPGARCAYVVGNSRIKGVEVFTDVALATLFDRYGYLVREIVIVRRRGGRKQLYEAVVFADWPA